MSNPSRHAPNAQQNVIQVLKTRAVQKGVSVKLASGKESNIYVDCKRCTLHGPSLQIISKALTEVLKTQNVKASMVAGVSVGGDPIVAGILWEAATQNWELEGLLVRKEAKAHGLAQGRAVDGPAADKNRPVWLVEDVISTGGSSLKAARNLIQEGYPLVGILALVDREMGGVESLQRELSVPVLTLCKLSQLE